jgi:hypothetical protein
MSNVINTTIIQNPQHTVNTTVQASQLNGGNLAQNFNLQALRIVKGSAYVASSGATGATGVSYVFINQEDETPLCLGPNDFIVAYAVANGNMAANTNPANPVPLVSAGASGAALFDIKIAGLPNFNNSTQFWDAGTSFSSILSSKLTSLQLNTNHGSLQQQLLSPVGSNQWVNSNTIYPYFTNLGVVNLTLVVLSGFPAQ